MMLSDTDFLEREADLLLGVRPSIGLVHGIFLFLASFDYYLTSAFQPVPLQIAFADDFTALIIGPNEGGTDDIRETMNYYLDYLS